MAIFQVTLYYKYVAIPDPAAFAERQRALCASLSLRGRILIGSEGINGTLEGESAAIEAYEAALRAETAADLSDIVFKHSPGEGKSFDKLKVKVRPEIVSGHLGEMDVDPSAESAPHLSADELRHWYETGEDFVVVDMRNDYEYQVGRFKDSVNPGLENFRDLPKALPKLEHLKDKRVVTVCTGGVRCEKASGYLKKNGFGDVYQLDGGMHTYMERYPGKDFEGALYVFDHRMTIDFTKDRAVVGKCRLCQAATERYTNCADDTCHLHFLCCDACQAAHGGAAPCSETCGVSAVEARARKSWPVA
jgi:UPF0176 protein